MEILRRHRRIMHWMLVQVDYALDSGTGGLCTGCWYRWIMHWMLVQVDYALDDVTAEERICFGFLQKGNMLVQANCTLDAGTAGLCTGCWYSWIMHWMLVQVDYALDAGTGGFCTGCWYRWIMHWMLTH